MKIWIAIVGILAATVSGCTVFRQTAVEQHVAASRDLTLQGLAANSSQDELQAQQYFSRAVESDPENVEARMLLAESLKKQGRMDEAIQQLEEALRIAPEHNELICQLGECYSVTKKEKYAYRLAQLALRNNKNSVEAWTLKAQSLWRMGLKEPALADFQRALRADPDNEELRQQMATLYLELGRPQRALTTLDRIAGEYDDAEVPEGVLLQQAVALQNLDRNREALDRLKIGFERDECSLQLAEMYVTGLLRDRDLAGAGEVLRVAQSRFPQAAPLVRLGEELEVQYQSRVAGQSTGDWR